MIVFFGLSSEKAESAWIEDDNGRVLAAAPHHHPTPAKLQSQMLTDTPITAIKAS